MCIAPFDLVNFGGHVLSKEGMESGQFMSAKSRKKSVTLADVAKDAGVAPITVSRVINGDEKVRDRTREKINASIKKLNYSPNIAARNLASGRPFRVCLLYGNPSSAYLGELLMGALEAASGFGARLVVERVEDTVSASDVAVNLRQNWDALIVPPPISDVSGIRKLVSEEDFPAVFISSATEPGRANEIRIDDQASSKQVTELLIERGHKRIGFVKGHPNQTVSEKRYEGFCRALNGAGLDVRSDYVKQGFFTYRSGLDATQELLDLPEPPTAIFASNDDMAAGALAAAAGKGMSVPRDLSVVGFDDSPIASTVWPNLTTVRQPVADMAAEAVSVVRKMWQSDASGVDFKTIVLAHHLVERDSVSVPRG